MKAQRLKITEAGWSNFSDLFCGVQFTNGISDEAVAPAVADHIGSIIQVEFCDDGKQPSANRNFMNSQDLPAPVASVSEPVTVAPQEAARMDASKQVYTKEALENIADDHGIAGLRHIAEQYGVKGRGIVELITEILKAQG
jgi:hypothetical protein